MGNNFKTLFCQAKENLEENIRKMPGSGLPLKCKFKTRKSQSQNIFTEEKKKKK